MDYLELFYIVDEHLDTPVGMMRYHIVNSTPILTVVTGTSVLLMMIGHIEQSFVQDKPRIWRLRMRCIQLLFIISTLLWLGLNGIYIYRDWSDGFNQVGHYESKRLEVNDLIYLDDESREVSRDKATQIVMLFKDNSGSIRTSIMNADADISIGSIVSIETPIQLYNQHKAHNIQTTSEVNTYVENGFTDIHIMERND